MKNKGLGESSTFCSYHPLVNTLYFALTIGITMYSISPYFLAVTFLFSWIYSILLKGRSGMKLNAVISIFMLIIMVALNLFFNNNGATVLLYINTNRITLESICFGIASG